MGLMTIKINANIGIFRQLKNNFFEYRIGPTLAGLIQQMQQKAKQLHCKTNPIYSTLSIPSLSREAQKALKHGRVQPVQYEDMLYLCYRHKNQSGKLGGYVDIIAKVVPHSEISEASMVLGASEVEQEYVSLTDRRTTIDGASVIKNSYICDATISNTTILDSRIRSTGYPYDELIKISNSTIKEQSVITGSTNIYNSIIVNGDICNSIDTTTELAGISKSAPNIRNSVIINGRIDHSIIFNYKIVDCKIDHGEYLKKAKSTPLRTSFDLYNNGLRDSAMAPAVPTIKASSKLSYAYPSGASSNSSSSIQSYTNNTSSSYRLPEPKQMVGTPLVKEYTSHIRGTQS